MKKIILPLLLTISTLTSAQNNKFDLVPSEKIKVVFNYRIPHQVFYKYVDTSYNWARRDSVFEEVILKFSRKDSTFKPIYRFEWINENLLYTVFKYIIKSDTTEQSKTALLYQSKKGWVEVKSVPNSNIAVFFDFFRVINLDFYDKIGSQDKSDIPAIDQIKAQFKDSEGILDIDKLGAYLKTKPKELAKYCDF